MTPQRQRKRKQITVVPSAPSENYTRTPQQAAEFERQCKDDLASVSNCKEVRSRLALRTRLKNQIERHRNAYGPLIRSLVVVLQKPLRLPEASIQSDLILDSNPLNADGPHPVSLQVSVRYPRTSQRVADWEGLRDTLTKIAALNSQLMAANRNLDRRAKQIIKASMIDLSVRESGLTQTVKIPVQYQEDFERVTNSTLDSGTMAVAVVKSKRLLRYVVLKEWIRRLEPGFGLAVNPQSSVTISSLDERIKRYSYDMVIAGSEICESLRSEVRLLPTGLPRREWMRTANRP